LYIQQLEALLTGKASSRPRQYEGWLATAAHLVVGAGPREGWRVEPGDGIVIVLYSSERLLGVFDKGASTDELVLEAGADQVKSGANARTARYQQGGQKLTFASTSIKGRLDVRRSGDRVRGEVSLVASSPVVDVNAIREVSRKFSFIQCRQLGYSFVEMMRTDGSGRR
jgi:hypothetical protein